MPRPVYHQIPSDPVASSLSPHFNLYCGYFNKPIKEKEKQSLLSAKTMLKHLRRPAGMQHFYFKCRVVSRLAKGVLKRNVLQFANNDPPKNLLKIIFMRTSVPLPADYEAPDLTLTQKCYLNPQMTNTEPWGEKNSLLICSHGNIEPCCWMKRSVDIFKKKKKMSWKRMQTILTTYSN